MSKTRVYEIAKELNVSSKELVDKMNKMGMSVANHMSSVEDNDHKKIVNSYKGGDKKPNRPQRTNDNRNNDNRRNDNRSNDNRGGYNRNNDNRRNDNRSNDNRGGYSKNNDNRRNDNRSNDNRGGYNRNNDNRSNDNRSNDNRGGYNRNNDNRRNDNRSGDNRGGYNRNNDNRRNDNRSNDNRGGYNRNNDNRSNDNRSGDNRGGYNRNNDNRRNDNRSGDNRGGYNRNNDNRRNDNRSGDNRGGYNRNNDNRRNDNRSGDNRGGYNRNNDNRRNDNRSGDNRGGYNRNNDNRRNDNRSGDNRGGYNRNNDNRRNDNRSGDNRGGYNRGNDNRGRGGRPDNKKDKVVVTFNENDDKKRNKKRKNKAVDKQKEFKRDRSLEERDKRNFDFGKKKRGKKVDYKEEKVEVALENTSVEIPEVIRLSDFAKLIKHPVNTLIMNLMGQGIMASINQDIDFETAELIAADFGIELTLEKSQEEIVIENLDFDDEPASLVKRAPVVTVMGHVDHGKTSLLDKIRDTGVASGEAGGITQHIGASEIVHNDEKIVFLDTPGHEAFTSLRARGAKVTDIAILVVAADDGVMPQTVEAIDHSLAAGVPIIIAINKMDKVGANPDRVKSELTEHNIVVEEFGGEVICVPVSAHTGEGIEQLLDMINLVAEMQELKANPDRQAIGTIIDANLDKGRGAVATVIVEKGTLNVGDSIFVGSTYGRVRAMFNHIGKKTKTAGPATCVEFTGLNNVPTSGEKMYAVADDKTARVLAEKHESRMRERVLKHNSNVTLEDLFSRIKEGEIKDLNVIIKADVQGSVEAIKQSLAKLSNDEVRIKVIHANVGTITESDVILASASNAIIIGFNVRPSTAVQRTAEKEGVDLRTYRIIYDAINELEAAMKGMLDPEFREVILGKVEIRDTFKVPNVGTIGGAYVLEGKAKRSAEVRLLREGIVIFEGKISSLKRFKDDAKEVQQGFECGIGLENYNDIKTGDIVEVFEMEEIPRD